MPLLCWLMLTLSLIKGMDSDSDLHDDFLTVHTYMYLNKTALIPREAHILCIECNCAAKDIWKFLLRERSACVQLLSQGRIILRLTESLEFLLIIRGGVAKARHISTSYKTPIKPPFDLFVSRLNAQVSCYASWRPDPGMCA